MPLANLNNTAKAVFLFCGAVLFHIAGMALYGPPRGPDVLVGATHYWGAFFLFWFFALSVVALGRGISLAAFSGRSGWLLPFAFGTAAASMLAMVLGHLGLIGTQFRFLAILFLYGGHVLHVAMAKRNRMSQLNAQAHPSSSWSAGSAEEIFLVTLIGVAVLHALFDASYPAGRGLADELRYHLVGPRMWTDAGVIGLDPRLPLIMQCSYWEYLFLWGNFLVAGPDGGGLIAGHLFARWTHALFGYGGTALAAFKLFQSAFRDRQWLYACVLSILLLPVFAELAPLAKNDLGSALWTLSGLALLFNGPGQNKRLAVAGGVLLGLGTAAKLTAAFLAVAGFGALYLWQRQRLSRALVAFALTLAPVLLRNWLSTDNPFFPSFNSFFQSPWVDPLREHHQAIYGAADAGLDLSSLPIKTLELLYQAPWIALTLLYPLGTRFAPWLRQQKWLLAIGLGATLIFLLKVQVGFSDFLRLAGPSLMVFVGCGFLVLSALFEKFNRRWLTSVAIALVIGFGIVRSGVDWTRWRIPFQVPPPVAIRNGLAGGEAKAWLRRNAAPRDLIISSGDNQVYYLSQLNFAVLPENPELGWEHVQTWSAERILRAIRARDARYLLDTPHWSGGYWSTISRLMRPLIDRHKESIVFHGRGGQVVVDLVRLEQLVEQGCVSHPEWAKPIGARAQSDELLPNIPVHYF